MRNPPTPRPGTHTALVIINCCVQVHGRPHKSCSVKTYAARLQLMMAQQQLAQECGAGDVYPRSWVAPIDAVVPAGGIGAGFHICWHVLWMEEAPGVTLMVLQQQPPLILPLLKKMNSTQLVAATVMELLTSQCDRHFQNIFIDGAGRLKLIDNDQALGTIPHCGANSELLPGSKYFNAVRLKYRHWYDKRAAEQQCGGHVDYRLLVDYR